MAFSLFRKKSPSPASRPPASRPPAARRSTAGKSPAAANSDGDLDAITVGRGLRLETGVGGLDPRVEQAAVLYAADHPQEARAALEAALAQGDAPEECWLMLLELYEIQGEKQRQRALGQKYTARFQRPAPQAAAPAQQAPGGRRLAGEIVAAGADAFSFLLAPAGPVLDIDASGLRRIDFVSAGILLNTMLALQQAGTRVRIHQLSHLVAALLASVGIASLATLETRKN